MGDVVFTSLVRWHFDLRQFVQRTPFEKTGNPGSCRSPKAARITPLFGVARMEEG